MNEVVESFIHKHQLLSPESTVLVAVSGGPDSLALLHFLNRMQKQWRLRIVALSVDHGLRGEESVEDLHYVEDICRKWKIEFVGTSIDVNEYKKKMHLGTQIAARELRYLFCRSECSISKRIIWLLVIMVMIKQKRW